MQSFEDVLVVQRCDFHIAQRPPSFIALAKYTVFNYNGVIVMESGFFSSGENSDFCVCQFDKLTSVEYCQFTFYQQMIILYGSVTFPILYNDIMTSPAILQNLNFVGRQ